MEQRKHNKDTLVKQANEIGINNFNFLAVTMTLPLYMAAKDIQVVKRACKTLNIDLVGAIEYQETKANGWHLHFATNKINLDYLLNETQYDIHIIKGYDLNGWLWYITKGITTSYIKNEQTKELAEPTINVGAIEKEKGNKLAEPTIDVGRGTKRNSINEQKGVFKLALRYVIGLFDVEVATIYKKAPT